MENGIERKVVDVDYRVAPLSLRSLTGTVQVIAIFTK